MSIRKLPYRVTCFKKKCAERTKHLTQRKLKKLSGSISFACSYVNGGMVLYGRNVDKYGLILCQEEEIKRAVQINIVSYGKGCSECAVQIKL